MTSIRDALNEQYELGLRVGGRHEAQRRLGVEILIRGLAVQEVSEVAGTLLRRALSVLEADLMSADVADRLTRALLDYLVEKNGHPVVQRDREDKVVRAAFEAIRSTVDLDGLDAVTCHIDELLTGRAANMTIWGQDT